jgi:hypothetical protein
MVQERARLRSLLCARAVQECADALHAHAAAAGALQVRGDKAEAAAVRLCLRSQNAALWLCTGKHTGLSACCTVLLQAHNSFQESRPECWPPS